MTTATRLSWCWLTAAALLGSGCVPDGTLIVGTGGASSTSSTHAGTGGAATSSTGTTSTGGSGGTTTSTGGSGGTTTSSSTGTGCSASQKLCAGQCVADDDPAYGCAPSGCAPCALDHATAACTAGACAVASCDASYLDCNGVASDGCEVNPATDVANCSACMLACTNVNGVTTCADGVCAPTCAMGFGDCDGILKNGCETNLGNDVANCGACAAPCTNENGTNACVGGTCAPTCAMGFGDCDGKTSNGCEANLGNDVANCGACAAVCTNANGTTACSGGACAPTCAMGFGDCDGQTKNGCETDLGNDVANCGACAVACTNANGTTACAGGACAPVCAMGFGDCDGNLKNGCEANLGNDVANCGACAVACTNANGTTACTGGVCKPTCAMGFADCDGNPKNGCEANLGNDVANCGACGIACTNANGTTACVAGVCKPTCAPSFGDCDGNVKNGCETGLASDPSNCGACGNTCGSTSAAWSAAPSMPTARSSLAVGQVNGILYAIGGDNGGKLQTNEAYDPVTKLWTSKAPMPTARALSGSNAAVVNGIVYVVGGNPPGSCTNTVEAYDPVANSWSTKASMPTPRCDAAVASLNGLIYAVGGTPTSGAVKYALVEVYNPATNTWASGPSMITCRQSPTAVALGGKLYVVGGWAGPIGGGQCQNGTASGTQAVNEVFDPGTNAWTSKAPMGTPRSTQAMGALNGKLYVAGGSNEVAPVLSTVESYDPVADAWTVEPSLPAVLGSTAGVAIGGSFYVAAGGNLSGPVATVEVFSPGVPSACLDGTCACNATLAPASVPTGRVGLAAARGPDGRIYAIAGQTSAGYTSEVDAYDPCTNTWAIVAPLPVATSELGAATGPDGRIYALGGAGNNLSLASAYAYDTKTNTWATLAPMGTARQGHGAATGPDGRIYAVGGVGTNPFPLLATVEAYTPATNTWTPVASMGTGRIQHAVVTGPDGRIYAMGGNNYACGLNTSVEAYNTTTNAWTAVAALPGPQDKLGAALGPDGRIYAISGATSGCSQGDTGTVRAYDVLMNTWTPVASIPTPRESFAAATGPGSHGFVYAISGGGFNQPPIATVAAYDTAANTW